MYYIRKLTSEFGCDKKLVGPNYSGASEMKHHVAGLQTNVLPSYPSTLFTYHYVHSINLVLYLSLAIMKECKHFFKTLSGLSTFFSTSSKRINTLTNKYN